MLYAMICTDKPNSLELRLATRPDHVAYLKSLGEVLKFAGPFLGADEKPNGSLVVVAAENKADAEAIASKDPYSKAGLFQSVEIRAWSWAMNNPGAN